MDQWSIVKQPRWNCQWTADHPETVENLLQAAVENQRMEDPADACTTSTFTYFYRTVWWVVYASPIDDLLLKAAIFPASIAML